MLHRLSNLIGSLLHGRAQREKTEAAALSAGAPPSSKQGPKSIQMQEHAGECQPVGVAATAQHAEAVELRPAPAAISLETQPHTAAQRVPCQTVDTCANDDASESFVTTLPQAETSAANDAGRQGIWLDAIDEYIFRARFQLGTPLAALLFHDKRHLSIGDLPPEVTPGNRHGQWQAQLAMLDDSDPAPRPALAPSAVGPIAMDGGDFLPFLISIRRAVEADGTIASRITLLRAELEAENRAEYVAALGGIEDIERGFFPCFASSISGLGKAVVNTLWERGLRAPADIAAAADAELLAIKGIGPARLKAIRAACLAASDPACEFVDAVEKVAHSHPGQ